MKKIITSSILLVFLLGSLTVQAELPTFPFIFADGKSERDVPPDKAILSFSIASFDKESSNAQRKLTTQTKEALGVLMESKIPREAITGSNIGKSVERARKDENQTEILGYYVHRKFTVKVNELKYFEKLVSNLTGVNNVVSIDAKFEASNKEEIESELIEEAAKDARLKASRLAKGMGVKLGQVFSISGESFKRIESKFIPEGIHYSSSGYRLPYETIFVPAKITIKKTINVIFRISFE